MTDTEKLALIDAMIGDAYACDYNKDAYIALFNGILSVISFGTEGVSNAE